MACTAMEKALTDLKEKGIGEPDELFSFKEFSERIGFDKVWEFEKKWAKD